MTNDSGVPNRGDSSLESVTAFSRHIPRDGAPSTTARCTKNDSNRTGVKKHTVNKQTTTRSRCLRDEAELETLELHDMTDWDAPLPTYTRTPAGSRQPHGQQQKRKKNSSHTYKAAAKSSRATEQNQKQKNTSHTTEAAAERSGHARGT